MLKKNLANIITCVRIAGAVAMLFLPLFTASFYIVLTLCGLSDALDGWVARRTGTQTVFGSRLDSLADLLFYTIMMTRVLPRLIDILPKPIWYGVAAVCGIRLVDYLYTALKFHHLASTHSLLNKTGSAMIFFVPYLMNLGLLFTVYAFILLGISAAAALEELIHHLRTTPEDGNIF